MPISVKANNESAITTPDTPSGMGSNLGTEEHPGFISWSTGEIPVMRYLYPANSGGSTDSLEIQGKSK